MSPAIRVSHLSKRYQLGLTHAGSIRELVGLATDRLLGRKQAPLPHEFAKINGNGQQVDEEGSFWALKDVSFEVQPGEVLGIIGRNGAGKSTILKILSRITAPTEGRIEINGRVASLLEVGTGFHPELTGRENVFLNGAILGMTKAEIRRKFDEIVAFAEIEKFIDTPVKRYTSGMYVRLAFAVAAHLEPEILIVDEVLAVGDAEFQKKCLGKMEEVSRGGRAIIFVSHHLPSVQRLCSRGIYLQSGTLSVAGTAQKAVEAYLSSSQLGAHGRREIRINEGEVRITSWKLLGSNEFLFSSVSRETAKFSIIIESTISIHNAQIGFVLRSLSGDLIVSANSRDDFHKPITLAPGRTEVVATVRLPLKMGRYQVDLAITDEKFQLLDHWLAQPFLTIIPSENSVLPQEWRGLLNEPVAFQLTE